MDKRAEIVTGADEFFWEGIEARGAARPKSTRHLCSSLRSKTHVDDHRAHFDAESERGHVLRRK